MDLDLETRMLYAHGSHVYDGDTFRISEMWQSHDNEARGHVIRIAGYNAPEQGEPGYEEATNKLSRLTKNQLLGIDKKAISYGRLVADVYILLPNGQWGLLKNHL